MTFSPQIRPNFTPHAGMLLAMARMEADRLHHNFVGTEHLLLGVIRLGKGTAVAVLQGQGIDLDTIRMEVEKLVLSSKGPMVIGNIPYTPRVKMVLALAAKEAHAHNKPHVGTGHILLSLIVEGGGIAARALKSLGVDAEKIQAQIDAEAHD